MRLAEGFNQLRSFEADDEFGRYLIVIPAAANWPLRFFLTLQICLFAFGGSFVTWVLTWGGGPTFFLGAWLAGAIVGEVLMIAVLAWNVAGREVIRISDGWLEIHRELGWIARSRRFELAEIRKLRYSPVETALTGTSWWRKLFWTSNTSWRYGLDPLFLPWGIRGGWIAFEVADENSGSSETHRFGDAVPEIEAQFLIEAIERQAKIEAEDLGLTSGRDLDSLLADRSASPSIEGAGTVR